jgi:hypothetical protein
VTITGADISNLEGLSILNVVESDFKIVDNQLLADLSGLNNLSNVGEDFFIIGNDILDDLSGLENLNYINGELYIKEKSLMNILALSNLDSIGRGLKVWDCFKLTNLDGLENLTKIKGGGFELISDTAIVDISALENLTIIDGLLLITNNTSLTQLSGLDGLTEVEGQVYIQGNNSLINIDGISNIDLISVPQLIISHNYLLSTCAIQNICDYLANPNGTVSISNNATGCNTPEEVEDACIVGISNIYAEPEFAIYPNPANKEIFVSASSGATIDKVSIFNQLGQNVLIQNQISIPLDISNLQPGVYIVEIVSGNLTVREKLIIK